MSQKFLPIIKLATLVLAIEPTTRTVVRLTHNNSFSDDDDDFNVLEVISEGTGTYRITAIDSFGNDIEFDPKSAFLSTKTSS